MMLGMARLLFKLRHVEADEFDEVTSVLDEAGIGWYQTTAGMFGFGSPALWVREEADYDRARGLIEQSQAARAQRLRQERQRAAASGQPLTFAGQLRADPIGTGVRLLLMVGIVVLVLTLPWLLWR